MSKTEKGGRKVKGKRCFISAPINAPIGSLLNLLQSLEIQPQTISDFAYSGSRPADAIANAVSKSDFVIAVLDDQYGNENVFFEIGYAHALGKPVLINVTSESQRIPSDLAGLLYVRTGTDQSLESLEFAIEQLASAPKQRKRAASKATKRSLPIGPKADDLLTWLSSVEQAHDVQSVEHVLQEAFKASGITVFVPSNQPDRGVDFAVWIDETESLLGNPLLVEVKRTLEDVEAARRARDQMLQYLAVSNSRSGIVVYLTGPPSQLINKSVALPNLFFVQARELIENLRDVGLGEFVSRARNRVVHGGAV